MSRKWYFNIIIVKARSKPFHLTKQHQKGLWIAKKLNLKLQISVLNIIHHKKFYHKRLEPTLTWLGFHFVKPIALLREEILPVQVENNCKLCPAVSMQEADTVKKVQKGSGLKHNSRLRGTDKWKVIPRLGSQSKK